MRTYCRAYLLADLRAFDGWAASVLPNATELSDTDVVYLCDDHTVVLNPVLADQEVIWDLVTAEWVRFCTTELGFAEPATTNA